MFRGRAEAPERAAVFAEDHGSGTAQVYLDMSPKKSQLAREPIGIRDIVGIHAGQVAAARPVDALIQTGREPEPPPVTPADDARVIEAVGDGQTLIVRAVVAEQKLKVAVALVQERADGELQSGRAVVKRHGDGDYRNGHEFLTWGLGREATGQPSAQGLKDGSVL